MSLLASLSLVSSHKFILLKATELYFLKHDIKYIHLNIKYIKPWWMPQSVYSKYYQLTHVYLSRIFSTIQNAYFNHQLY